jgi:acyl-CoA thioesterase
MAEASERLHELFRGDRLAATLGLEFVDGAPGRARVRLRVEGRHLNFNGTCHGGVIFSLADTAFGLASNSHGPAAAAIDAHLSFNSAVREGEVITAHATERVRGRRLATYAVDVTREDGRLVSVFTGTVFVSEARPGGAVEGLTPRPAAP